MGRINPYDERYARDNQYWGNAPTTIARALIEIGLPLLKHEFGNELRIVDLGSGDGRDALYYAANGFDVTCVDRSLAGLEAILQKAQSARLSQQLRATVADLNEYRLDRVFHAVASSGALHYIVPCLRDSVFSHYKESVSRGGLFAATVIVTNPMVAPPPDAEEGVSLFRPGELREYLGEWKTVWQVVGICPCNSGGTPHQHAFERIIAQRP